MGAAVGTAVGCPVGGGVGDGVAAVQPDIRAARIRNEIDNSSQRLTNIYFPLLSIGSSEYMSNLASRHTCITQIRQTLTAAFKVG